MIHDEEPRESFRMINHLVEVPLLLVKGGGQAVGPLHVHHEILHLVLEPLFRLLQRGALGVHRFDLFFSLLETLRQLFPAGSEQQLKLYSALEGKKIK